MPLLPKQLKFFHFLFLNLNFLEKALLLMRPSALKYFLILTNFSIPILKYNYYISYNYIIINSSKKPQNDKFLFTN